MAKAIVLFDQNIVFTERANYMSKKQISLHPRPYQYRPRGDISWIVLTRDVSTDSASTWSYALCSKKNGAAKTKKTGASVALEALLLILRTSSAQVLCLTSEDWQVLESALAQPIVPVHGMIQETVQGDFAGTAC